MHTDAVVVGGCDDVDDDVDIDVGVDVDVDDVHCRKLRTKLIGAERISMSEQLWARNKF